MASNLPLNANIIDCLSTKDDPHSLQAHVSLSKVHGEDGAAMVAQGAAESIFSPIISNANISNVHGHHDLSALLLESRLDDISEGVNGVARDEGALDLEAEFKGFSKDPYFLMEFLHGDSSSPSLRGRKSLNNGSHGGRGGRGRGAWVAHEIQDQKPLFNSFDKAAFLELRSAYVSNSKGFLADSKGSVQEYGRSNT
ncbi:hypothetical protein F0562_013370 [Nyssa sinensis]|uniref:Uncharacterized protein n=1 Tax=Nyssa sinensis TaxID=561372 RepID=A0A5J4ZMS9_9ASTE|nr:hypothetical protein F0562_013370 [Nyssa sinensis]